MIFSDVLCVTKANDFSFGSNLTRCCNIIKAESPTNLELTNLTDVIVGNKRTEED
jgi:hypothetical protein